MSIEGAVLFKLRHSQQFGFIDNSESEQHHAGTDDGQDDETKQDDSKGRKTNKQSHVDVDVTITNKNKSTKLPTKKLLPLKVI